MVFTCVLYQGINGMGFGASSNGVYWRPKRGSDPFDTWIEYKSSLAIFFLRISNNITIDKL